MLVYSNITLKVLLVTGGIHYGSVTDNTEIYDDDAWRTASALPFSQRVVSASAITLNNRVLLFGNDKNCT